jgi:ferritin heavy chain
VDVLTSDFLDEQYKGQRKLAGQISTLGKMVQSSGTVLGEFMFDKELLK